MILLIVVLWMKKYHIVMSGAESYITINYVIRIGADCGLLSGSSRLPTGMGTASTIQVEEFAFKVSDKKK